MQLIVQTHRSLFNRSLSPSINTQLGYRLCAVFRVDLCRRVVKSKLPHLLFIPTVTLVAGYPGT